MDSIIKRICVLEDDESIREVLEILLTEENYQVNGFASVSDFLKGNKGNEPDLFLLDIMLPDGNGIDLCSMLKSSERTRNIPVLMMSAHSNQMKVEETCSAEGFVKKPFDIYDLLLKVESVLAG
ncbi:response regulator [Pedobacter sp. AW31-3R]|uniref:response regulator n=1 Tax=Pedobacter sp. AW31-3R TaxID=3445781 RepID=UPI003F9F5C0C